MVTQRFLNSCSLGSKSSNRKGLTKHDHVHLDLNLQVAKDSLSTIMFTWIQIFKSLRTHYAHYAHVHLDLNLQVAKDSLSMIMFTWIQIFKSLRTH